MNTKIDRNKAKGMLWGLVVGDCLGSPVQFTAKDNHRHITKMEPCPVFGLPPGYWTDDSSMALCVIDSYVRKNGYDLEDIGRTFVRWYREGYLSSTPGHSFDVGGATARAMHAIERGSFINGEEESQGNGSIMRLAPSYLIARAEDKPEVVREVNDLTHKSARVRETAASLARLLGELADGNLASATSAYKTREEVDNSGWAVSTLQAALWALRSTESFADGMIAAVNLGGDADTIGAVYGQLAGAYYGFNAIPREWVEAVKDWQNVENLIEGFLDRVCRQ